MGIYKGETFEEAIKAGNEIEQTVEFGEELFRIKCPAYKKWDAWSKKNGKAHKLTGSVFDDCSTCFQVDGQDIYSSQHYEEAVKTYKLKHGIPLDVGPEWRPGQDIEAAAELKKYLHDKENYCLSKILSELTKINHADFSQADKAPTSQQMHCHLMHIDGKVTNILERLNKLDVRTAILNQLNELNKFELQKLQDLIKKQGV